MAESGGQNETNAGQNPPTQSRRHFLTRTATDNAEQLLRRASLPAINREYQDEAANPELSVALDAARKSLDEGKKTANGQNDRQDEVNLTAQLRRRRSQSLSPSKNAPNKPEKPLGDTKTAPISSSNTEKLGTFSGVFVPTSLNVFSILMFIRFGFILGQAGLVGTVCMLLAAYAINLVTTLSISAVASNGTVRGGGAYYLISRSLGPEFGGSIGIISYLGFVFNTGMNAVGLVDCLVSNFGSENGVLSTWLPEGRWWQYLWASLIVLVCVAVCFAGSSFFTRASNGLLLILLISITSIPISVFVRSPYTKTRGSHFTEYTGLSFATFKENLLPRLTSGAAGSQIKGRENYQDLFGVLFPATGGIFAGASMSGDLKNPSRSIPRGTLYGLVLTFITYTVIMLTMAAAITRKTFYINVNVIEDVNLSSEIILLGEAATSLFSVLMGIIGPAKQLQAISRDSIFPGLKLFGQGNRQSDDPTLAILLTLILTQITILFDINSLASLVTMSYLVMGFSLHLACLLLKLSSAPNFRPSFHYFNQWTALAGAILSIGSMFFVDATIAAGCLLVLVAIFLIIHYTTPPKPWGSDVTSGLVYHQVRKYLLRLKTEHVKYWRPQILLFVNDPRRGYKLVQFANSLKKGGLFILGHVIVTENFGASVPEARRQQTAWTRYIEYLKIKSFVNVAISPSMEWGARNIVLSAGLGGMRPNIVMMGFYNLQQFRQEQPLIDLPSPPPERKRPSKRRRSLGEVEGSLPTDLCYVEKRTDMQSYVLVLEDMILKLQINVAVAVGFSGLELPKPKEGNTRKYIDLWPIQMSAEISSDHENGSQRILTTNFDTYTLILQLGCILNTVRTWKKCFKLRVAVFVEYESDVEEERSRVISLLESLRIEAEVLVFWLACGNINSYELIVNDNDIDEESEMQIHKVLGGETWWKRLRQARGLLTSRDTSAVDMAAPVDDGSPWRNGSYPSGRDTSAIHVDELRQILHESRYRPSFGRLSTLGVSFSIRTHRLDDDLLSRHASHASDSGMSESNSNVDTESTYEPDEEFDDMDISLDGQQGPSGSSSNLAGDGQRSDNNKRLKSSLSSKSSSKKSESSKKGYHTSQLPTNTGQKPPSDFGEEQRVDYDADAESQGARGRSLKRLPKTEQLLTPNQDQEIAENSKRSRGTSPAFTSAPLPATKISNEEGQGPSIMFADVPHPRRHNGPNGVADSPMRSIYQRSSEHSQDPAAKPAQGYPGAASAPLSFNDLPSRAQHLILNELMSQNSEEAAVIFTTLPAPEEGTFKSESDSLTYLTDLEVLTQGLGPVLLVHSNSMTVTTNL